MSAPYCVFLFRAAPYSGPSAQDGIDALLAFAAFEQPIKPLFIGDGVFQLAQGQTPLDRKNIVKMISAFEIYDIDQIYVHKESALSRNLRLSQAIGCHTLVSHPDTRRLIQGARQVLSF